MGRRAAAALAAAVLVAVPAALALDGSAAGPDARCVSVSLAVVVDLDDVKHAPLIEHERAAVLRGRPRILHLDRAAADAHRAASLRGIPTRVGFDRDEYPPAVSAEGGAGADVAYVPSSVNRSGGAVMANELRPFCDGQAFIVEP